MRVFLLTAAVIALFATAAQSRPGFHYTHRIMISGTLVDHWTVADPSNCGLNGDGTTTIDFKWVKPERADVLLSETKGGTNGSHGAWALLVPMQFGIWADMQPKPVSGTITRLDDTQEVGQDCDQPDKSGCGTHPLVHAKGRAAGYDRHRLSGDLDQVELGLDGRRPVACGVGQLESFSQPLSVAGRTLLMRMGSPRRLRSRRALTISASVHKKSQEGGGDNGPLFSDDVTRTMTVTFTPLG